MKNKILIYSDSGKRNEFLKSVNETLQKANDLILAFNSYQDFRKIETLQDFEALHADPLGVFDKTILQNIDIKAKGNKQPDASALSALFQIDRPGYMAKIGQTEPINADCPDCAKKTQTIKVKNIRSNAEYNLYAEYLFFINGLFCLNNKAINEHCDIFNIYAESPDQISLLNHWLELCKVLNDHNKKYPFGQTNMDQVCRALKLQQLNGTFVINNMALSEQIKYMKQ